MSPVNRLLEQQTFGKSHAPLTLSKTLLASYDTEQDFDSFNGTIESVTMQIRLAQMAWLDGQLQKILPEFLYQYAHGIDLSNLAEVFNYFFRHKIHLERQGMNLVLFFEGREVSKFEVTLKMEAA